MVAVNSDASVKFLKGEGRPVDPLRLRMLHVRAFAEAVIPFDGLDNDLIERIEPDVILRGYDQVLEAGGRRVVAFERFGDVSTTSVLAALAKAKAPGADSAPP